MATTAKTQKERAHGPPPRLTPRPTAASAARAARIATNRNLTTQSSHQSRQSPSRAPPSSPGTKPKSPAIPRQSQKTASKTDLKATTPPPPPPPHHHVEIEETPDQFAVPPKQEPEDTELKNTENLPTDIVIADETSDIQDFLNIEQEQDLFPDTATNNSFEAKISQEDLHTDDANIYPGLEAPVQSRPVTPMISSRPQTPKNLEFSRPQTPRISSRPTTPASSIQRKSLPSSRPNTPLRSTPPVKLRTPSNLPVPSPNRVQVPISVNDPPSLPCKEEDVKSAFMAKQRQFHRLKKELDLKQQAILEVFDNLRSLSERMTQEGVGAGEGLHIQELVVFNVGDWTAEELAQLCRDAVASNDTDSAIKIIDTTKPLDECALAEIDTSVTKVPSRFADLCLQAFTARQELIDWVKELVERVEEGQEESLDRIARYNAQGLELCETLRELKSSADDAVDMVTQLSRQACQERSTLVSVGESLVREVARLQQDLEARAVIVNEMREIRAENDTVKALEDSRRELEEERAAKQVLKDKLAATESHLRQTRIRVTKMDRQLREAEATISSLTGTVKSLEDQSRQREVQLEARARKLKESLKTGEVTSNQIAQHRDLLQAEVQSLKDQIEEMIAQHQTNINDLNKQIKELKAALEDQKRLTEKEVERRQAVEEKLLEYQTGIDVLKEKNNELESLRPNPDLPTEREMDLWAELQATKDTLRMTEDEVTACKREKVRFLETLTKISESENKVGMQQKLAAELLSKEEIIGKMQIQIRELTKNIKLNEQKVIQYEQYVRDLQAHNRAVANCQEAPNGISYQDLQQEIMNLRMGLLEAVHRNDELSEVLAQKEQQLEQQDKTSRAQARVIKVREELINMLKNKETEQSRELSALQQDLEHRMKIVDEVNKQIAAKAEEIQELFATLENKQQQIHRLEKIVLALEEQQRRAQAQRTRHEEKIAALEHELAAGNRRERKFIFF